MNEKLPFQAEFKIPIPQIGQLRDICNESLMVLTR